MSTGAPTLSIVVPVFNGESYVEQNLTSIHSALDGLPESTQRMIEVVVSDNHSTDNTGQLIAALQFSSGCLLQPPEHLPSRTAHWNFALSAASGTWSMMLHADDMLDAKGLTAIMAALQAGIPRDVGLLYGQHRTFRDPASPDAARPRFQRAALIDGKRFRRWSLGWSCPFPPFVVFRSAAYRALGTFDESLQFVQDWDMWLKITATEDILYLPVSFGMWRSHPYSPSVATRFADEHLHMSDRLEAYGLEGRTRRMIVDTKGRAKARWFDGGASTKIGWRSALVRASSTLIVRICESLAIALNSGFRVAGHRRLKRWSAEHGGFAGTGAASRASADSRSNQ